MKTESLREESASPTDRATADRHSFLVWMLRWITVLPAGIATYFAVNIVISLLTVVGPNWPARWTQTVTTALSAYFLVAVGSAVAPGHRLIVAIALTALHAAILGFSFVYVRSFDFLFWVLIQGLAGIVATVIACYQVFQKNPVPGPSR